MTTVSHLRKAALAAADEGSGPADCDLPAAIGGPATRALTGAGPVTLAQVATRTEEGLPALHGVGPGAVRALTGELSRRGTPPR
ncbi:hypothetical protein [Nocardiopsis tropica]|uniref:Helix-hairpin-helix domain-containing protein n=1 Tax=Nocardiopsis tropica TaxID=109330 RepID=A0ABU7L0Q6_9ACTN|nr:hypothetical protein [Nocardiopsis umidischolae]MEE2055115.1 hypothetical protein [Nocardiopsis umidischolae]